VFNTVVRRHKLGEVANEYTSENLVLCYDLCAKNFHNRLKFDKVLTKNKFAQFSLRHGVDTDSLAVGTDAANILHTEYSSCDPNNGFTELKVKHEYRHKNIKRFKDIKQVHRVKHTVKFHETVLSAARRLLRELNFYRIET